MIPIPEVTFKILSNMSALADNLGGEFYVLDSYSVDDMEDKDSIIRIEWEEGGIKCPVSQCSVTFCTSKQTFSRHWEETHREWYNYQICPKCGIELRRFIELQQHMRQKHDFLDEDFSAVLPSVKVMRKINVKYIDPGPYRPPIFPSTFNNHSSMIRRMKNSNSTNNNNNNNTQKKSSSSKDSRSSTKSHSSLLSKRKTGSSTAVIKPKVQKTPEDSKGEDQSSSSKLPTWAVPDIPSDRQLLVDYLKWADSVICQVGNSRLEAKRRLEALDVDSELQKERQLRKKLEEELESTKAELEALRHLSDYTSFSLT